MGTFVKGMEILKESSNLLTFMKKRIEDYVLDGKRIFVSLIDSSIVSCRNGINVEDYEIENDHILLSDENFELHIDFDNTAVILYEEDPEECFTVTQGNIEFNLYFI